MKGAVAGAAATLPLQATMMAGQKAMPDSAPPLRDDPGHAFVDWAEEALPAQMRKQIPAPVEAAAGEALALGYGVTAGALYGALRNHGGSVLMDGTVLGLATWAAGYLGWLPGTGLMPPVWKQTPKQIAGPIVLHVAFGMATVALFDRLRPR
jgi:hypothetical protein